MDLITCREFICAVPAHLVEAREEAKTFPSGRTVTETLLAATPALTAWIARENTRRTEDRSPFGQLPPVRWIEGGGWELRACQHCGEPFWTRAYRVQTLLGWTDTRPERFCSRVCQREDELERNREYVARHRALHPRPKQDKGRTQHICAHCGETFEAKRSDATYCSPRCRQAARRAR